MPYQPLSGNRVAIYALSSSSDHRPRYVGASTDPDSRLNGHLWCAKNKKNTTPVSLWIADELEAGNEILIQVLEVVPADRADETEGEWIDAYRAVQGDMLNRRGGGRGEFFSKYTITRAKQVNAPIIDLRNGDVFANQHEAAEATGVEQSNISSVLRGRPKAGHGDRFCRISPELYKWVTGKTWSAMRPRKPTILQQVAQASKEIAHLAALEAANDTAPKRAKAVRS